MDTQPEPECERRKTRDAQLRTQDELIAQHLAESLRSGELQSAQSFGKPLAEAEGWLETPVEFRLPFKILKNAGMAPPEVELFHRRAALRDALQATSDGIERERLQRQLAELEQAIALRLEALRVKGTL